MTWSPHSWQAFSYQQAAIYPDTAALSSAVETLSQLPPLVTSGEIKQLKQALIKAGQGEAFLLQGGDCAESFDDCRSDIISNKLKILLQMSLILLQGIRKPIIHMGRIAGQYTKPRSLDFEVLNGITLPCYRGDLINGSAFTPEARTPDPNRLLQGYSCAAMTLNFIRALLDGGFADLHHPNRWDLRFMDHSPQAQEYRAIVNSMTDSLAFLESIGGLPLPNLNQGAFYTSHEALHLHYEQALTRQLQDGNWYNLSTHLPWLGLRTAHNDSAHVEFLRGLQNPTGIKVGPNTDTQMLVELITHLNPNREEGAILLITRMGADTILDCLPPLIAALREKQLPVTWSCDPMHGNTELTPAGIKTRQFDTMLRELLQALTIHREHGSHLGGIHLELTGDNVTECTGGARGLTEKDLETAYHSLLDPRLNYEQALEMSIQFVRAFRKFS